MDKIELEKYINSGLSTREIARKIHKSQTATRYWLKKYGFKTNVKNKKLVYNKKLVCNFCGEKNQDDFYSKRNRCKICHNKSQTQYCNDIKRKSVEYKGGKCELCGYNKNYAALDFHHVDSSKKDINWKTSRHWGWERLKKELDKCKLVCKNCHAEIHYPQHNFGDGCV